MPPRPPFRLSAKLPLSDKRRDGRRKWPSALWAALPPWYNRTTGLKTSMADRRSPAGAARHRQVSLTAKPEGEWVPRTFRG